MDDLSDDLDLRTESDEPPLEVEPRRRSAGVWIVAVVLVAAASVALYVLLRPEPMPVQQKPAAAPASSARTVTPSLGSVPENIVVPPLDTSDSTVRTLVGALSSAPPVTAWLATKDLIRSFTIAVASLADGTLPRRGLNVLRPASRFATVERGGTSYIDPRSFSRYDAVAEAVNSIDPAGAARVYATFKPRIGEAYRELGLPDPSFDHVLERAIVGLLNTPVIDEPIAVRPKGIGYAFVDDRLESLSASQKQLVRMGPGNSRIIQARVRAIALALGIPADQLPGR